MYCAIRRLGKAIVYIHLTTGHLDGPRYHRTKAQWQTPRPDVRTRCCRWSRKCIFLNVHLVKILPKTFDDASMVLRKLFLIVSMVLVDLKRSFFVNDITFIYCFVCFCLYFWTFQFPIFSIPINTHFKIHPGWGRGVAATFCGPLPFFFYGARGIDAIPDLVFGWALLNMGGIPELRRSPELRIRTPELRIRVCVGLIITHSGFASSNPCSGFNIFVCVLSWPVARWITHGGSLANAFVCVCACCVGFGLQPARNNRAARKCHRFYNCNYVHARDTALCAKPPRSRNWFLIVSTPFCYYHSNEGFCIVGGREEGICSIGGHTEGFCNIGRHRVGFCNIGGHKEGFCIIGGRKEGFCIIGGHKETFCIIGCHKGGFCIIGGHKGGFCIIGGHKEGFCIIGGHKGRLCSIGGHEMDFILSVVTRADSVLSAVTR